MTLLLNYLTRFVGNVATSSSVMLTRSGRCSCGSKGPPSDNTSTVCVVCSRSVGCNGCSKTL